MAQTFERAKSRLNNIRAIEPLLGALRTLSMGTWQMALNKLARMQQYERQYDRILVEILPVMDSRKLRKPEKTRKKPEIADTIILVIGTERGLCGKFNQVLAENAANWIQSQTPPTHQVWAMGSRMIRELDRLKIPLSWRKPLPAGSLPSYQQSYLITQNWLEQYENHAFNDFTILFNEIDRGGYQCSVFELLPYKMPHPPKDQSYLSAIGGSSERRTER